MKKTSGNAKMPKPRKPMQPNVPALEWLRDVSGRAARVTAIGSRRLLVENHRGIIEYSDDTVRLSTACGALTVHGHWLALCEVRPNALIVRGCILRVEFPEEEGSE